MADVQRRTKRGFVMTGGGAKGLYEAGVIHAFHMTGMEFDVITGSSIGAINSIFYAEYQFRKQQLSPKILADPIRAVEAMEPLVRAFLHAWWQLPDFRIIDDSETGPLGKLKDDLLKLNLSLPQIVRLLWWYTDPDHSRVPPARAWPDFMRLLSEAVERLQGGLAFLRLLKKSREEKRDLLNLAIRAYLARFGMETAIVPNEAADQLKTYFTQPTTPLRPEHLAGEKEDPPGEQAYTIIPADRTLREFKESGIDVRLTRANFRTGRLEVSTYYSPAQFVAYLRRHAFRWECQGPQAVSLGSGRLHMVGNPNAIYAALASGRFPGVFAPMPIQTIYGLDRTDDPENILLKKLLNSWLNDATLKAELLKAYRESGARAGPVSERRYESWRRSQVLAQLFPHRDDTFIDGGTIDNTPANSAIDAIKEWVVEQDLGYRDVALDLYTVFLHPAPDPGEYSLEAAPSSYQVVKRTLQMLDAATLASNATNVRTINTFGQRAEESAQTAISMLRAVEDVVDNLAADIPDELSAKQKAAVITAVQDRLATTLADKDGKQLSEKLFQLRNREIQKLESRLPLHVEPVEIYPDTMPMSTLQFTERLGFRPENAVNMITVGCYNTLWALRGRLEEKASVNRDEIDERALALARQWMDIPDWPDKDDLQALGDLKESWVCRHDSCIFYERYCARGRTKEAT